MTYVQQIIVQRAIKFFIKIIVIQSIVGIVRSQIYIKGFQIFILKMIQVLNVLRVKEFIFTIKKYIPRNIPLDMKFKKNVFVDGVTKGNMAQARIVLIVTLNCIMIRLENLFVKPVRRDFLPQKIKLLVLWTPHVPV